MFLHGFPILFILAAYALSVLPSAAQNESMVSLQFLAFPKMLQPEPVELVVGEKKTIKVQTPGNELSPTYKMPRIGTIVVGETIENADGKPAFQIYGRAQMIDASQQIILLFRKGEKNSDGFVVLPIDGELSNFSGGSYLFINASKINVAGKIGDKKFKLNPGQRELLQPATTHVGGGCQVTLAYQREEEWKIFKDTRWSTNKSYRSLVFFLQHPVSGRLIVAPIVDILPYIPTGTG